MSVKGSQAAAGRPLADERAGRIVPYREMALDRLSSPEQLDQILLTTRPHGWLALLALLLLLLVALVWAAYGTVPTEVSGEGILLHQGGVSRIVAAEAGELEELRVRPGEVLSARQVVATLRLDGRSRQLRQAEQRVQALRQDVSTLERETAQAKRRLADTLAAERETLAASLTPLERNLAILEARLAGLQESQRREAPPSGTADAALAAEEELNTARYRIATVRLALDRLESRRFQETAALDRRLAERRVLLREEERGLASLRDSVTAGRRIVTRTPGRVLEVFVHRGQRVAEGDPILSLESLGEELGAVLFLPAAQARQVRTGMATRISPAAASRRERGHLVGEVTGVGDFPASALAMQTVLGNEELVDRLTRQGPVVQIDVALPPSPSASAARRPAAAVPFRIASGTLVTASILLREEHPIELLFPAVRAHRES